MALGEQSVVDLALPFPGERRVATFRLGGRLEVAAPAANDGLVPGNHAGWGVGVGETLRAVVCLLRVVMGVLAGAAAKGEQHKQGQKPAEVFRSYNFV